MSDQKKPVYTVVHMKAANTEAYSVRVDGRSYPTEYYNSLEEAIHAADECHAGTREFGVPDKVVYTAGEEA